MTNRFIYHYCAHYQIAHGSIAYIDGIAMLQKRITCMEDYSKLKQEIEPTMHGKLTIDSLSFIGMEHEK